MKILRSIAVMCLPAKDAWWVVLTARKRRRSANVAIRPWKTLISSNGLHIDPGITQKRVRAFWP